jgi:hypothetical protein
VPRVQVIAPSFRFQEKAMSQKIRIMTRANQFEQRKQEDLQAGYLIEDQQPFPIPPAKSKSSFNRNAEISLYPKEEL